MGVNSIRNVVTELFKKANVDGFFTNHSLHRTGTTRLFREGIDRKLVKEFTRHVSDAIDQYQVTLDAQRAEMSRIIAGEKCNFDEGIEVKLHCNKEEKVEEKADRGPTQLQLSVSQTSANKMSCECAKKTIKVTKTHQIGELVNSLLANKHGAKATIK